MKRLRRDKRNQVRGLRVLKMYAEAARQDAPQATRGQIENMVIADIEDDFEDSPLLSFLLKLFKIFAPFILDGLFDD
jgi:hypothetical protein